MSVPRAEHHIVLAETRHRHDHIGESIVVEIASGRDVKTELGLGYTLSDCEPVRPGHVREVDPIEPGLLAENHIGNAEPGIAPAMLGCADDHIGEPIAVDVSTAGHAPAGKVVRAVALDHEAVIAQVGNLDDGEHDSLPEIRFGSFSGIRCLLTGPPSRPQPHNRLHPRHA